MNNRNKIISQLQDNILRELSYKPSIDYGLLGGDLGRVIFLYCSFNFTKSSEYKVDELMDKMIANIALHPLNLSYCSGLAGLCFGLEWLDANKYINIDRSIVTMMLPLLAKGVGFHLGQGNIDYLHGSIGIARYLTTKYNASRHAKDAVLTTISWLYNHIKNDNYGGGFWLFKSVEKKLYQNISLSHGISSIGLFLCNALRQEMPEVYTSKTIEMLQKIAKYILSKIVNPDLYGCYTLNSPINNPDLKCKSRLAWCYGDLGVAVAILQIGITLSDNDLLDLSRQIVSYSSSKRLDPRANYIKDAGLCHGAFGVAMMYRYFSKYFETESIQNAINYWERIGISYFTSIDNISQFGGYSIDTGKIQSLSTLIDGDSGIGLYLMDEYDLLNKMLIYEK